MIYRRYKVFNTCYMPAEVYDLFKSTTYHGAFTKREVIPEGGYQENFDGTETYREFTDHNLVDKWLLESGACPGEYVIIED